MSLAKLSHTWPLPRVAVALVFLVNGALLASWVARIPALKDRLGLDAGELGLTLLASPIGALLAFPLTGALLSRLGSQRLTLGLSLLTAAMVALIPWPSSQGGLMAVLFFWGMFNAATDVAMNANGTALELKLGRPILSGLHACWSIGNLLAAALAGVLIGVGLSLEAHLSGVALGLGVLGGAAALFLHAAPPSSPGGPIFALPRGAVWGMGALVFCAFLAEGALADWGTVYLRDEQGVSESAAAWGYAAYTGSMVLGRLLGDELAARLGERALLAGGGVLAALGLGLSLLSSAPLLTVLGFMLVGFGIAGAAPLMFRAATRVKGQNPDLALTAVTTLGYTAFLTGPALIGGLAQGIGLRWALAAVLLLLLCIPLLALRVLRASD